MEEVEIDYEKHNELLRKAIAAIKQNTKEMKAPYIWKDGEIVGKKNDN